MTMYPIAILDKARKAVPAVNFALGVAGVAAAGAIVAAFVGANKAGVILLAAVFLGMVLLFIFSTLINSKSKSNKLAGEVLVWAVLTFFVVFLVFTASAVAVGVPCNWAEMLNFKSSCAPAERQVSEECKSARAELGRTEQAIANFIGDQCILATRIVAFVTDATPGNWARVTDKARTYHQAVVDLDKAIREKPIVLATMTPSSYGKLLQLLDQKDAISTSERLTSNSPPLGDQNDNLRRLAERLRSLATDADQETRQLSLMPVAGCPAAIGPPRPPSARCLLEHRE